VVGTSTSIHIHPLPLSRLISSLHTSRLTPSRPDLCDGTYPQFCNYAPTYGSITSILEDAGQTELLEYMRTYWLPDRGSAEHFWEHEWRKHGTCINTLAPGCYGDDYREGDEVVDFFTRAVEIFKVRWHSSWLEWELERDADIN
jgi:hypothetical protein